MALRGAWVHLSMLLLAALAPPAAVAEEPAEKAPAWTGQVSLGGSLASGNSDAVTGTFEVSAERKWDSDELRLELLAVYGRSGGKTDKNKQAVSGKWRRFLRETLFVYGSAELGRDSIQEIRWRLLAGMGPGWRAWNGGEGEYLDLEAGLGYRHEEYSDDTASRDDADLRAGLRYQDHWGEHLQFTQTGEFLMPVNRPGGWLARTETILAVPVAETWSLRNSVRLEYLHHPPSDNENYDLLVTVGLEYHF